MRTPRRDGSGAPRSRRAALLAASLLALAASLNAAQELARRPNLVVIFADDMGYGDPACFGHPTIATPHLDRLAAEGVRFTQFYATAPICTPSRAALLTGRYPVRSGCYGDRRGVFFPNSPGGLPAAELTFAEHLRAAGYATMMAGKWHLGHLRGHLPIEHGFDTWLGVPYSNDMTWAKRGDPPFPLMRDAAILKTIDDQSDLTRTYTDAVLDFIAARGRDEPFLIYLAHTFPHVPLAASAAQRGESRRGLYGDAVEEIDRSTGRIVSALRELGLAEHTLVLFTSDNGPWLRKGLAGGSAGLLRGGKGTTWEGGMRVPAIAWWPGTVAPGRVLRTPASTLDVLPTCAELAGSPPPPDLTLDGTSLAGLLRGGAGPGRRSFFYYRGSTVRAVRHGRWKLHLRPMADHSAGRRGRAPDGPLLYDLEADPSERHDRARQRPELVERLSALIAEQERAVPPAPSQVDQPPLAPDEARRSLDYARTGPGAP